MEYNDGLRFGSSSAGQTYTFKDKLNSLNNLTNSACISYEWPKWYYHSCSCSGNCQRSFREQLALKLMEALLKASPSQYLEIIEATRKILA